MIFADISFSTEALGVVGGIGGVLCGAVGLLFRNLMASKEAQLASYKEISEEAINHMEKMAAKMARKSGVKVPVPLVPIVPEHQSPPTRAQRATAEVQTMRARLTAVTLSLKLPARRVSKA